MLDKEIEKQAKKLKALQEYRSAIERFMQANT